MAVELSPKSLVNTECADFWSRGSFKNVVYIALFAFADWNRGHALQLKIPVYDYIWLGWITIAPLK